MHKRPDLLVNYITTDWALGEKSHNDWSVLLPFGVDEKNDIWILPNIVRIRATPERVVEALLDLMVQLTPAQVGIEASHITKTIGPFLRRRMQERRIYTPLWDGTPTKDKVARCASIRGRMQQGKVFFPDTPLIRETFLPELLQFPAGKHDDMVDALAWAGIMLDTLRTARPESQPAPDPAPAWSMSWMKDRLSAPSSDDRRHVPRHLNGKVREPVKRPGWAG
jgi:predicted phage terminase large subunit-like protein